MDKKEVRSLKITKFLACFVLLIFGLSFFLWPDDRAKDFAQSIGLVLAVAGIIEALILLIKSDKDTRGIGFIILTVICLGLAGLGVFFAIKPDKLVDTFGYLFGIAALLMAAYNIYLSLGIIRKNNGEKWGVAIILSLITFALAVIVIIKADDMTNGLKRFVGVMLIVAAISEFWNSISIKAADKNKAKAIEAKTVKDAED